MYEENDVRARCLLWLVVTEEDFPCVPNHAGDESIEGIFLTTEVHCTMGEGAQKVGGDQACLICGLYRPKSELVVDAFILCHHHHRGVLQAGNQSGGEGSCMYQP